MAIADGFNLSEASPSQSMLSREGRGWAAGTGKAVYNSQVQGEQPSCAVG